MCKLKLSRWIGLNLFRNRATTTEINVCYHCSSSMSLKFTRFCFLIRSLFFSSLESLVSNQILLLLFGFGKREIRFSFDGIRPSWDSLLNNKSKTISFRRTRWRVKITRRSKTNGIRRKRSKCRGRQLLDEKKTAVFHYLHRVDAIVLFFYSFYLDIFLVSDYFFLYLFFLFIFLIFFCSDFRFGSTLNLFHDTYFLFNMFVVYFRNNMFIVRK